MPNIHSKFMINANHWANQIRLVTQQFKPNNIMSMDSTENRKADNLFFFFFGLCLLMSEIVS